MSLINTVLQNNPKPLAFLTPILILSAVVVAVFLLIVIKNYKKSTYYQTTKMPFLRMAFDTGRLGEYLTYNELKDYEKSGARFLFNLYVPKENGETSEIDVLMITSGGIMVLESKNYSGWIFGSENQQMWTQTLPAGKKSQKNSFYNPIRQNQTHIQYLQKYLDISVPMASVIVFSDRCTLKNVTFSPERVHVINRQDLLPTTASVFTGGAEKKLSSAEIEELYQRLYPLSQTDEVTREKHIKDIQNKKGQNTNHTPVQSEVPTKEEKTAEHKCPRCGGELILRTAKTGANAGKQFYGCANYPKCRYIQTITFSNKGNPEP